MTKKENGKSTISIFCDYCAWGLWLDGAAIDADYLKEDLDFPEEFVDRIREPIERWQNMYEGFNLYTSEEESNEVYASSHFKEFEELGLEIADLFRELNPKIRDKYNFEYLDERTSKRLPI